MSQEILRNYEINIVAIFMLYDNLHKIVTFNFDFQIKVEHILERKTIH